MNKLLKDAIADAKAVRETALANAKIALEEAFAPRLQSMLSHKIAEEADDELEGETMETEVEDHGVENGQDEADAFRMKELAGIGEAEGEEVEEVPTEDEFSSEEGGEEFSSEEGGEDYSEEGGEEFSEEPGDEELEELLRQLEEEESYEEHPETGEAEGEHGELDFAGEPDATEDSEEEIDLDELIQSLREGDDEEEEVEEPKEEPTTEAKKMKKKMMETEKELNEAYSAVKYLRTKLNEVNLLNAKLLYVNKLFRKNGLTESQKIKIIETFDRAKTVRETKLIYTTLAEATSAPVKAKVSNKTKVMEGFASTASKKTNIITEGNEQVTRFQKLAGLK